MTRLRYVVTPRIVKRKVGELPHVDLADVESGGSGIWTAREDAERDTEALLARCGDLVLGKLRPNLRKGFIADRDLTCSAEFLVLQPRPGWDTSFLLYVLLSPAFTGYAEMTVAGVKMPRASWESLRDFRVPQIPMDEQLAIARFLDRECERLDSLRSELDATAATLDEAERKLVDESIVDAPRRRLGWVATIQTGLTLGKDYSREAVTSVPYLRVANVQAGRLDLSEVKEVRVPSYEIQRCRLEEGDVLMTEGGDMDKLGRGTVWRGELPLCLHQNHVFAIRVNRKLVDPEYLALVTRSSEARAYFESTATRSTNLASTNSAKVRAFRFPVPDLDVQREVVERFARRAQAIDKARNELRALEVSLAEYRDALITEAVMGQLDIARADHVQTDERLHAALEGQAVAT